MIDRHRFYWSAMCALTFSVSAQAVKLDAGPPPMRKDLGKQVRKAAEDAVGSLTEDQRKLAVFPHDASSIRRISLLPGDRVGVRMGDLNDEQLHLFHNVMATVIAPEPLTRVAKVFNQDKGKDYYYFARFWDGQANDPLVWRMEGHHFSMTVFVDEKNRVSLGTVLMGGREEVWQPWDKKVRAVYASLDEDQRNAVRVDPAPRRTGREPYDDQVKAQGLSWSQLTEPQRVKVDELLNGYRELFFADVTLEARKRFTKAGGAKKLRLVFSGDAASEKGEYHCGLTGGGAQFEFDTRDGHTHMLLYFGAKTLHQDWNTKEKPKLSPVATPSP